MLIVQRRTRVSMTLDARNVSYATQHSGPWLFRTINSAEMGNGVVNGWTICCTNMDFCMTFHVFTLYQRLENWTVSAMDVPDHVVYGRDLG